MIIRNNRELRARYHRLDAGDCCIGTVSAKHLKPVMLIDLVQRGVDCYPSALSQMLNSSKVAQAFIYQQWMVPQTTAICRRADLIAAISHYAAQQIGAVVSKQDHMHCGHGVRRWESLEHLYNGLGFDSSAYPFVLQPFVENFTDVRVIMAGDYEEAYTRRNPDNFRSNLAAGGKSHPYELDENNREFCRAAMQRGRFPYAHIDLMVGDDGLTYLCEIALNGGTHGARIGREELDRKKKELLLHLSKKGGSQ
jgi:ribosomal protein S6--L-glutamate ligase